MSKKNLLSGRDKELQELAEQYEAAKAENKPIYLDADDLADLATGMPCTEKQPGYRSRRIRAELTPRQYASVGRAGLSLHGRPGKG